jgi:hypothetical protein
MSLVGIRDLAKGLAADQAEAGHPRRPTPGEIIPEWWATSSRNGGQNYLGMASEIIPESRATSIGF